MHARGETVVTKEHIYSVVKKHVLQTLDTLEESRIDPSMSMKELGATSLDIVEIVSTSMRELKVKVPRNELSKLANIGGLVELLHTAATAPAATPTSRPQ
jgi:acyl carrier protein